eukprot:4594843-Amphidinium_carterae.1
MANPICPPTTIPERFQASIALLDTELPALFGSLSIPYHAQCLFAKAGFRTLADLADRWPSKAVAREKAPADLQVKQRQELVRSSTDTDAKYYFIYLDISAAHLHGNAIQPEVRVGGGSVAEKENRNPTSPKLNHSAPRNAKWRNRMRMNPTGILGVLAPPTPGLAHLALDRSSCELSAQRVAKVPSDTRRLVVLCAGVPMQFCKLPSQNELCSLVFP